MTALGNHEIYGNGLGYIIQRGGAGRTEFIHQVDVRGGLSYVLRAPYELKFSVDVLNLLNQQSVLLYDQNYTTDAVQPIQGIKCDVQAVGKSDPVAVLQSACPDLKYLKTIDGRLATVNANFGKPITATRGYQTPIQVRFGLALAF
jgi:glucose dehydrogenase